MKKRIILLILIIVLVASFVALKNTGNEQGSLLRNMFNDKITYKEYKAGDRIYFADGEWYVMYDSSSKEDYVTLIYTGFYYLEDYGISLVLDEDYKKSDLNVFLQNKFVELLENPKLKEIDGYKVRLLNKKDMDSLTEYTYDKKDDSYELTKCPDYICVPNLSFGTMIETDENNDYKVTELEDIEDLYTDKYLIHLKYYNLEDGNLISVVNNAFLSVRPVVNVMKESIGE